MVGRTEWKAQVGEGPGAEAVDHLVGGAKCWGVMDLSQGLGYC